jgi:hypothetical protein
MRRLVLAVAIALGMLACAPSARACPMCKVANESGENAAVRDARPRAYMYSILFMLSMPATLLTGYGFGFYRMHKRQQSANADLHDSE